MSEGKYTRLGTVQEVRDSMGHMVKRTAAGVDPGAGMASIEVTDYSRIERAILRFIEGMAPDADVHIEISKDLWR